MFTLFLSQLSQMARVPKCLDKFNLSKDNRWNSMPIAKITVTFG